MEENIEFTPKPKEGEPWDVIIIGSGPAGLTAAVYTTRGAASTLIIGGDKWGGQLMLTTEVENYPGFAKGILGPELMQQMRIQAERFNAEFIEKNAKEVNFSKRPFEIKTPDANYLAKSIIIATGAETRWLGVPGEEKLRGRGVSSCAPCDAPFYKDKNVVVVGGGDAAMEEALVLTKYAKSVTLVHRRDEFRASAVMQKKVFDNQKINIIWDTEVVEIKGEQKIEKVVFKTKVDTKQVKSLKEGKVNTFKVNQIEEKEGFLYWEGSTEGLFVAIGHTPSTEIFKGQVDLDEKGYVKVQDTTKTSVDGVFVSGDVHDIKYKQAVTAAAYGCMAAMDVLNYLENTSKDAS